ncbi:MAG: META domain-containing protein [Methanomethylovorans sp.]|nr:META domain-containing protein [Methanomethylovorans sp.]
MFLILALFASIAFIIGCVEQGTEFHDNGSQDNSASIDLANITNITWQWAGMIGVSSDNMSIVPNKDNYTLELHPDGTYSIRTDCNSGSGNYATDGNNLTIEPGMITLAYCGDQSLESQYLSFLWKITSITIEDGQLLLSMGNNSEKMLFINVESVKK